MKSFTLEEPNLKVVVFDNYGDFDFDSYYIFEPNEAVSGAWEVWLTDWNDPDMEKGNLRHKLVEVHSEDIKSLADLHLVLSSLKLGFRSGYDSGKEDMQNAFKFCFEALCGRADDVDVLEAAYQHFKTQ